MSLLLTQADARHLPFADGSVQCCVTSPPYWGLRDYGVSGQLGLESSPDAYVQNMVRVFREVRRVLRDDGTCWLNLGDSYAGSGPSGASYQSETTKRRAGKVQDGSFRISKTLSERGLSYRDKKPVPPAGLKSKDLVGIPWRVAFALQADGWYLRSDIIWSKPNPMPESVTDRPTKAHEYLFLLSKNERYFYAADAIAEPSIHAGRVVEYDGTQKNSVAAADPMMRTRLDSTVTVKPTRNVRTVWNISTQAYPDAHFATMPEKLAERCILAGSKAGDIVIDPFMGSGTVARVALRLGRRAVGCDLNPAYIDLQRERTRVTYGLPLEDTWCQCQCPT